MAETAELVQLALAPLDEVDDGPLFASVRQPHPAFASIVLPERVMNAIREHAACLACRRHPRRLRRADTAPAVPRITATASIAAPTGCRPPSGSSVASSHVAHTSRSATRAKYAVPTTS